MDIINDIFLVADKISLFNSIVSDYVNHYFIPTILTRRALSFSYVENENHEKIEITCTYCKDSRKSIGSITTIVGTEITTSVHFIPTLLIFTDETNILELIKTHKLSKEGLKIINLFLNVREEMKDFLTKYGKIRYIKPYHNLLHFVNTVKSSHVSYSIYSKESICYVIETGISLKTSLPTISFDIYEGEKLKRSIELEFSTEDKVITFYIYDGRLSPMVDVTFHEDGSYVVTYDELNIPDRDLKKIGKYVFTGLPEEIREVKVLEPIYTVISQVSKTMVYFMKYIILLDSVIKKIKENPSQYYFIISKII